MTKIKLIWNTVRYLKPIQIYWRIWLRLQRPRLDLSPSPPLRQRNAELKGFLLKRPSLTLPNKFTFLNISHLLQGPSDWNNPEWEKLWLYNLHYHDDLNALDSAKKALPHRELIQRWVDENPATDGNGWEPYPASLRIVNWIKWAYRVNPLEPAWNDSLVLQVRHLRQHLEYHLLGNHLFANAKALVFAGLYFDGAEADAWLKKGLQILDDELSEQVLDDGGHFELSAMYHCIILEDLIDLVNLACCYPDQIETKVVDYWRELVSKMLLWLKTMTHPDGKISLFNDAAFGIAAEPDHIFDYANRLGINADYHTADCTKLLPCSGYARLENEAAVVLADVARVGPDYIPGHAHADTLTFELSLFGHRIIVDSGTSCYGSSAERLRQRSTSAHNTVEIDGVNSSEVWGGFRVARRAYPLDVSLNVREDNIELEAGHDGYRRISQDILHHRKWSLGNHCLLIEDKVGGTFGQGIGRLMFSPDMEIEATIVPNNWSILWGGIKLAELSINSLNAEVTHATYHPEFGRSLPTSCLKYEVTQNKRTAVTISWADSLKQ